MISFRNFPLLPLSILIGIAFAAGCGPGGGRSAVDSRRVIGPGGGGAQFRPTVSPHDPNLVLVACDMTGAYITHDGGSSWRQFNLRARVDAFAFDPVDPNVIYAGSSGLFRSEDRGERWRLIFPNPASGVKERMVGDHADHSFVSGDNYPGGQIQAIRVDPENPARLYIAVRADRIRIFHSADRGAAWSEVCGLPGRTCHLLCIDPSSPSNNRRLIVVTDSGIHRIGAKDSIPEELPLPPNADMIVHAACGTAVGSKIPVIYVTTPTGWKAGKLAGGVFRSDDLGASWKQIIRGLEAKLSGSGPRSAPEFTLLACSENEGNNVYLAVQRHLETDPRTGRGINCYGICRTIDAGESWEWVLKIDDSRNASNKTVGWVGRNYGPSWGEYPLGLGAGPSRPEVCYATDFGTTYRTEDGGKSWEEVYSDDHPDGSVSTRGLDVTTCYGVHFDPFDPKHLTVSYTDIGCFHSHDGGNSWRQSINGVPQPWINTCYWLVFDPEVRGRAWSVWADCHDLPRPKMFRGGNFERYLGGVCRSDDNLETWHKSNDGLPDNCVTTHIVLDPNSPPGNRRLYVAGFGKGVYKSVDDGRSWRLKNEGISGNLNAWRMVLPPDGTLYLLVARGLESGKVTDGAIYISRDAAESWQPLPLPPGVNAPNDMVFDPVKPDRLYLACWPGTVDGEERHGGLYVSEDGGKSWRNIFNEAAHVYAVALDAANTSTLFINTFDSAAYRSDDGGRNWRRLEGYNFKWGHRPVVDPHNEGMLYLTTFGGSVWHGPAKGVPGAFEDIYPF